MLGKSFKRRSEPVARNRNHEVGAVFNQFVETARDLDVSGSGSPPDDGARGPVSSRPQSRTGRPMRAGSRASAVPQEPAPSTARV
ncbi:MAG: hypothetical protein CM1200mP20_16510 [Pseudomonadota bacterium]|nr:MAG: hypothetical protein CM1200mP20_16510 [Pseudomonadota bacterium]